MMRADLVEVLLLLIHPIDDLAQPVEVQFLASHLLGRGDQVLDLLEHDVDAGDSSRSSHCQRDISHQFGYGR